MSDDEDSGIPDDLYLPPLSDDEDDDSGLGALDSFGEEPSPVEDEDHDSGLDGLDATPAATTADDDSHDDLAAIDTQLEADSEDDEPEVPLVDASSPSGAVTVWVAFSGLTQRIDLTSAALKMSEPALADEIEAVADVATKRATSAFQYLTIEILAAQGMDRNEAQTFVTTHFPFASPADARAAEAALAERGAEHKD